MNSSAVVHVSRASAHIGGVGHTLDVLDHVLAEQHDAEARPVIIEHRREMLADERGPFGKRDVGEIFALEDPRIADRRAADHHGIAAGLRLNPIDVGHAISHRRCR